MSKAGVLAGQVAFVTGGGSGLGRGCAMAFAQEGAAVVLTDPAMTGAMATVASINACGGMAEAVHADAADAEQTRGAVALVQGRHDGLDIAVNNAGIISRYRLRGDITD